MTNPTALQQRASDPASHVWVGANAGSGKTKVLVDRVLRLLLQGTPPDHILCITYTKAAAAEMENRLQKRTREWVKMPAETLTRSLQEMSGVTPTESEIANARRLFAVMTDCPVGVRVLTIHSFCQQVLGQFPQEAGIAPHFKLLEAQEEIRVLVQAKQAMLTQAYNAPDSRLGKAIAHLTDTSSESSFDKMLGSIMAQRIAIVAALHSIPALFEAAGLTVNTTPQSLSATYFGFSEEYRQKMRHIMALMVENGSKTDVARTALLADYLESGYTHHSAHALAESMLTDKGAVPERFPTGAFRKYNPVAADELHHLAKRAEEYISEMQQLQYCLDSEAMLHVAEAYLSQYEQLKAVRGVLDYADLIERTLALLTNSHLSPWVLYKLDGQIDHLLMDEAQDVSITQWQLVEKLTEAFFDNELRSGNPRSLFIVGDEKQSIFGFQGAAPEQFIQQRVAYERKAAECLAPFAHIPMQTSFRSGEAIMTMVDAVFSSGAD